MADPNKKIGPITLGEDVLITLERDVIYVSQDNITYPVVAPQYLSTKIDYEDLGLSFPVQDVSALIYRLETYIKLNKIKSEDFAREVLGISASVFSNMKRKAKEGKVSAEKMVMWARLKFFLDNHTSSLVPKVADQLLTDFGDFEVIEEVPEVADQLFTEFGDFEVVAEVVGIFNQHLGPC